RLETPAATAAPEPASLTLLATGALGLLGYRWRRVLVRRGTPFATKGASRRATAPVMGDTGEAAAGCFQRPRRASRGPGGAAGFAFDGAPDPSARDDASQGGRAGGATA